MTHTPQLDTDQNIDRVLRGLRATTAPTGLEARIAQRLRATPDSGARTFFGVILSVAKDPYIFPGALTRFALATTAFSIAIAIPLTHLDRWHHANHPLANWQTGSSQTEGQPQPISTARTQPAVTLSLSSPQSRNLTAARATTPSQGIPGAINDDPDAIALAETLAPSHPAPAQPLTPQERLLVRATRQGQPIEVAELELAREPLLRAAAEARERSAFAQVARSLFAPLAAAEAIEPTSPAPDPTSVASAEPSSSQ